jgi:KaiC/GvpD/RAD55 family RecA-like ATPase
MTSQSNSTHRYGLWCDLHDYDQLFLTRNEKEDSDSPEGGLPFGASLLLSGPPGSGKTTFALALARSIMIREANSARKTPSATRFVLFYISPEVSLSRLRLNYHEFGWFDGEQEKINGSDAVWITPDDPNRRTPTFHSITTYPEMDRPVPSPDDQVNHVFNKIAKTITPSEGESDDNVRYIVIVDSMTALLKGCLTPGDERRQTHEILHKFSQAFGTDKLALILMTAEQDHTEDPSVRQSLVEDFLAGFVIRLAHQPLPLGRTIRTLQILKSQGVHMVPGIHNWSIITGDRYDHYLRTVKLRNEVFQKSVLWNPNATRDDKTLIGDDPESDPKTHRWGTVVIFARPKLQHSDLPDKSRSRAAEPFSTGTPGLDEMLIGDQEYWLRPRGASKLEAGRKALQRGKTTLLAGTVGTGTTRLCLQFLLDDALRKIKDQSRSSGQNGKQPAKGNAIPAERVDALLVLLNVRASKLVDETFEHFLQIAGIENPADYPRKDYLRILDFTQSNFDFNQLVSHLRWAIREFKPNRIAFDGLSEYLTRANSTDAPGMLEAISSLILHHPTYLGTDCEQPVVMMTYELKMKDDPLAPQSLGVSADNIIAVRQVTVQDEIHKVVYVLKSGDWKPDQNIRELVYRPETGKLEVRSGLDTFNGLLTKDVKKAEVLLQLFGENSHQREFNDWLKNQVSRLAKLDFTILDFSRPEIGRTLEDTHSQTLFPPADLKLVSVDEWWLSYQWESTDAPPYGRAKHELIDLRRMWDASEASGSLGPSWQDYLFFELNKSGPVEHPDGQCTKYYGVPAHLDFGLFCVNAELLGELEKWRDIPWRTDAIDPVTAAISLRSRLAAELPSLWAQPTGRTGNSWFSSPQDTICGVMNQWRDMENRNEWAFSFDIATRENCVSFFFELAWAFGASEDCLSDSHQMPNTTAMQQALLLLQYLVLEGFMPHRATAETGFASLFSRHYYSTLRGEPVVPGEPRQAAPSSPDEPVVAWPRLVSLPWFPGGNAENTDANDLGKSTRGEEILRRTKNLWDRCRDSGARALIKIQDQNRNSYLKAGKPKTLRQVFQMTMEVISAMAESREAETTNGESEPETPRITQTDLAIMMRQHLFRLRMLLRTGKLSETDFVGNHNDLLTTSHGSLPARIPITVPAGYRCSGSWYYGVHSDSSSPSLARELLQEMTSLEASKTLARLGAGIPSRADFFEIHGDEPVPGMEYLSWNQLVTECGATVRRRSRAIKSSVKPAKVHQVIHREVLDVLQRAYLRKPKYKDAGDTAKNAIVKAINAETAKAIARIMNSAIPNRQDSLQ